MKKDVSKKEYWEKRYFSGDTGWDIGYASPALKKYIDTLNNKNIKTLIPGAGSAYEAEYMYKSGFNSVYVLDISCEALRSFSKRFPHFPEENIICEDFFHHTKKYDLIIEQTFFCAIDPARRKEYAKKTFELLNPGGILAGLFFHCTFDFEGPPFGGSKDEYKKYFSPCFEIIEFDITPDSIKPRAGRELFGLMKKIDL